MGEAPDRIHLVDGAEDVANVEVRDESKVVWLSQTTLSVDETMETVDALKERFPLLVSPPSDDICYATQNRQVAVKQIGAEADLVIVVGSRNSSNSVRLVEVALRAGAHGRLPGGLRRRDRGGLAGGRHHGRRHLRRLGPGDPGRGRPGLAGRARLRRRRDVKTAEELHHFSLPKELRRDLRAEAAAAGEAAHGTVDALGRRRASDGQSVRRNVGP